MKPIMAAKPAINLVFGVLLGAVGALLESGLEVWPDR